ncbi:alpha/beta hydrolase [Psychroflexus gondwanensis]|nr:esterase [Psychroflexus gondwanensis]
MSHQNQVSYQTTNTYSTLNKLTNKTQNIWIACHGIGFLSKYFISYFEDLNPEENYIIAPQAPSKYYQTKAYKYIGASWLTKENRELDTENILNYLDALLTKESLPTDKNIILMGFSQGVSVVTRWMAQRHITCDHLVLHSGSIPDEFDAQDFNYLPELKTSIIYGSKDGYLTEEKIQTQLKIASTIFPNPAEILKFEGKHEMHKASLEKVASAINL